MVCRTWNVEKELKSGHVVCLQLLLTEPPDVWPVHALRKTGDQILPSQQIRQQQLF